MKINYEDVVDGDGKKTAQRAAAGVAGTAAAAAVASTAATIGCGSVLCTVGAPVIAGAMVAAGAATVMEWVWDSIFD